MNELDNKKERQQQIGGRRQEGESGQKRDF